jgi:hypothetical protein
MSRPLTWQEARNVAETLAHLAARCQCDVTQPCAACASLDSLQDAAFAYAVQLVTAAQDVQGGPYGQ